MNYAMLGMVTAALAFMSFWLLPEVIQDRPARPATRWQIVSYWLKIAYVLGGVATFAVAVWRFASITLDGR
jgi:hypothetical protein